MTASCSFYLVPGEGLEPSWNCFRRILSPLQSSGGNVALRCKKPHRSITVAVLESRFDCIEAHKPHGIQARGATQTATGGSAEDKRLLPDQKILFTIEASMCTVMVRRTHFVLLFLRWLVSLFSLCLAPLCARGASDEITHSFCFCLSSRLGRLHRDSRATSLTRLSRDRASRTASAMPTALPTGNTFRKKEVTLPQGALSWGRLAH